MLNSDFQIGTQNVSQSENRKPQIGADSETHHKHGRKASKVSISKLRTRWENWVTFGGKCDCRKSQYYCEKAVGKAALLRQTGVRGIGGSAAEHGEEPVFVRGVGSGGLDEGSGAEAGGEHVPLRGGHEERGDQGDEAAAVEHPGRHSGQILLRHLPLSPLLCPLLQGTLL